MDDELHHYYSGLAMLGLIITGEYAEDIPDLAHALADAMLQKPEGLLAIKKTKERKRG